MQSMIPLIVMFGAMILLMVWMSSRQRKAQAAQQEKVKALGVGDEVRTHSGFFGLIVEEYDDVVILETESGAHTKWARQAIAGPADPSAAHADAAPLEGETVERSEGSETSRTAQDATALDASASGTEDRAESLPDFGDESPASADASREGEIPGVTARGDEPGTAR
ncbi:preprotein translocase subunit YajC [Brachybacterium sp. ACRRE]|uniref:preprotein translocase subunit YajC n=1 Tax=Brachybacterium sp. ACRRE TaxID=2918184 RepID=UPI001EF1F78F|nr:preprotein translocase subunit YajC [Brachybacterium sp. ACRRE]MCG7309909.1 preprotein translocase subunit YajC [Brachybacterium sp. ACRRE]